MKKIFLLYGHYNEKSFNAAIRDTFVKTAEENGNTVDCVDLYKDKILNKDESFFLDQDYTQHGDVDLNIVHKLKKYVKDMSPNSKDVVWKYIDLLMKLCLKILQF